MKVSKKKRLAIIAGCMMLYSNWWASVAMAEEPDNVAVEEVEVTDTKLKERQSVQTTTVTADDIKAQGAQNASDVLKNVTGLTVSGNNTSGKATVAIRGSDANNTKVFVDGVPLSPVGNGVVDLSSIPADSIEKIEVIKGAVPVQYGSDAAGGVIYITTKKGSQNSGTISASIGSWNTQTQSASFGGSTKNANFFFSAKQSMTDGYTDNAKKKELSYSGKIGYDLDANTSVSIFGSYSEKREEVPNRYDANGLLIVNPGGAGGSSSSASLYRSFDVWSGAFDVRYDPVVNSQTGFVFNHKFNANNNLSLTMYQSQEQSTMFAKYANSTNPTEDKSGQSTDGKVRGIQLQNVIKLSPVNTFTWGYNRELRTYTEIISDWDSSLPIALWSKAAYSYTSNGYYAQDEIKVGHLTTRLGYRYNEIKDVMQNANNAMQADPSIGAASTGYTMTGSYKASDPVASLNYALSDTTALHAAVGKSFRYPQPQEMTGIANYNYFKTVAGTYPDLAIPMLKPEETINREVGVAYTNAAGLSVDVTLFRKHIANMIQSGFINGEILYYSLPAVQMTGYETDISQKLGPGTKAFFQYTRTHATDPATGQQVNDVPQQKFTYGLNYAGKSGTSAYLSISYVGATSSAFSNSAETGNGGGAGQPNTAGLYQSILLPAHHTVDFKLSKEKTKGREVYVKLSNLTDEKYYAGAYLIAPGRYTEFGEVWKFK
ncbi:MAG: TonB-dependent receptor [Negativicutes bacterium]|nr:TonB-dependent receptor [Negativicutes bacterium]MDR3591197.1 TonB-dependent receptor [Negativicutes bacterium]